MTDIHNFIEELMSFLTEEDIGELEDKAGVRFPLNEVHWSDLCYVCCWMAMKRDLPNNLHNRMLLGEDNDWTRIYIRVMDRRMKGVVTNSLEDLFYLAG